MGVGADGLIRAIGHDVVSQTASFDNYLDGDTMGAEGLYRADAILTAQRLARLDLPRSDSMRSPGDASGSLAFECAIDEAAYASGVDPVEFRIRNDTPTSPASGKPFSSRRLVACFETGAENFGWKARSKRRDGEWLIGFGAASAMRDNMLRESSAEVTLLPDGRLEARLDMTDPGTGSYTVLTQIAAEALGLPVERVTVRIGDTDFPRPPVPVVHSVRKAQDRRYMKRVVACASDWPSRHRPMHGFRIWPPPISGSKAVC